MPALLDDSLVIVLAGGAGERLYPLTKDRAKPAVYFGGPYRIIDFALSNCINSGLRRIFIATQYKSLSLNRHIRMGWNVVSEELGEFIEILAPQKRVGQHWYLGTADAVYQNLYSILREMFPDCAQVKSGVMVTEVLDGSAAADEGLPNCAAASPASIASGSATCLPRVDFSERSALGCAANREPVGPLLRIQRKAASRTLFEDLARRREWAYKCLEGPRY